MEIARPQVPEKPPIPAKPRFRPAPPRPPKPSITGSSSTLSLTCSSPQIDNEHSHSTESHTFQNGMLQAPNLSAPKLKLAISARANSVDTLSRSTANASQKSPHRPPFPPSVERKGHLAPSSSFSLPASFRNRGVNKADAYTPPTHITLNPFVPATSVSPQKSPIRHVSPPRKVKLATGPKPIQHPVALPKSSTSRVVQNTDITEEEEEKSACNDVQPSHTTPEKNSKPITSVAPLRKHSTTPPERPTSPPSRSALSPSNSPSKSIAPSVATKPQENSSVETKEKDVNTTVTRSTSERKQVAPPPLPKNPPRGGVPRKPRQSSFKLTSTSETNLPTESQQIPESKETIHNNTSGDTNAGSCVTFNNIQPNDVQSDSQLLVQDIKNTDAKLMSDTNSHNNGEARLQYSDSNVTNNCENTAKIRTPPRPRPRTRPSLCSKDNEDYKNQLQSMNSDKSVEENNPSQLSIMNSDKNVEENNLSQLSSMNSDKSVEENILSQLSSMGSDKSVDENNLSQNSLVQNVGTLSSVEKKPESEYAEVYQGDTDSLISLDDRKSVLDPEENVSSLTIHPPALNTSAISKHSPDLKQSDTNICLTTQNIEITSAISLNPVNTTNVKISQSAQNIENINSEMTEPLSTEQSSQLNSNESTLGSNTTNHSDIFEDSKSIFQEEPEATFGMLKEIEELLKNKLGNIELDLENISTRNSQINSQHIEHREVDETRTNCEDSISSHRPGNSPAGSPVRPPRPKRQASITKLLGSHESLNASVNNSSTECLVNLGMAETPGQIKGTGKKVIPAKPKRSSIPRVSRSHSDVTGMKSILDSSSPTTETDEQPLQEEVKPFLPPRLESLRRSESSTSCQSPPPLPPRNKPRSSSLKEIIGEESEPPALPSRSSLSEASSHSKKEPEIAENLEQASSLKNITQSESLPAQSESLPAQSESSPSQSNSSPAQLHSKATSSARLRPARKAPPPPPSSPRRSATFSPGDNIQSDAGESSDQNGKMDATQVPASPTVKRTSSECSKRPISEVDDHCYHEISESIKIGLALQENLETQPPVLPPRIIKTNSEGGQTSSASSMPDDDSVKVSAVSAKYQAANSQNEIPGSPKTDKSATQVISSSPKEQKHSEKMAKSALIQKVAQGLGFGKSFKMPKVPEITLIIESKKLASDDSGIEKVSTSSSSIAVVDLPADTKESDPANTEEIVQKTTPPTGISDSTISFFGCAVSEVSQQSTSSEQEGTYQNMEEIVSSGTDTEPEEDKEEIYVLRKAKKVFFIAKEIVSSEDTFVDVLKLLNIDFRHHISKSTESLGHSVIPSETLNKILDFLPQLQNFNEDLLKDLKGRIENWETNPRLADIFVKKGPFLKLYSSYIRNFESATAVLEDTVKKNSAFAASLKEFELSPRCAKLALKHYMLKPIQRIPQYKLLLQDYLKQLNEASPDYKDTVTALNIVSEVADHANDSMRHGDNVQKLLEVQRSLIGQFEVIQPGRVLLKQGELQKLSRKEMQPRMFFLFNDVLLYTTPATSGYKINNILPLTGMKINFPKLEDYKFEFNIISVQRSFTLSVSSPEEKDQWVTALQTAIEENAKKHHTFQTVKQGPQTSLLDKDFVLGHKAPLWVPDARVTMCMLCLLEFTLTWRRHHCRSCGRVVCSHCSENKAPLRYLKYEPARVCDKCYETLREDMTSEYQHNHGKRKTSTLSQSEEDSFTSVSEGADDAIDSCDVEESGSEAVKHDSGLSLNHLMARFQKIRISNREKRKPVNFRPSVLKEVCANDEGSDMSGYLRVYRSRKWKRLWFVVKGKVLYTYKASEDMAATESMPLLGYEVTRMNTWFEGAEPDLLFELTHQNNQPLTTRKEGDKHSPRVVPGAEKTTQRLIFRTDSAAATTKWVTVLREASLTYQ